MSVLVFIPQHPISTLQQTIPIKAMSIKSYADKKTVLIKNCADKKHADKNNSHFYLPDLLS
ncbi:hypothetical protein [Xenorhabdus budapestensis]|uniref:Uncharacterized protein n=1 Tax=Xenorhabdus budapestensis TaxID=290110 RepID=A0ABX7VGS6_XENBU|nr:hypothetical protein [Xenorhabdus budapestensis]QTL38997.1 hypothetical protein HGO23_14170 [Xenorhabdus budapestensis]